MNTVSSVYFTCYKFLIVVFSIQNISALGEDAQAEDNPYLDVMRRAAMSSYRYSGLGKRAVADDDAHDIWRRASSYRYAGLGKRSDESEDANLDLPPEDAFMDKRAAGFRYSGLGKRYMDDENIDGMKRALGYRYSGLGKRGSDLDMSDKRSAAFRYSGLGKRGSNLDLDMDDKRSAAFRYSGLGKRAMSSSSKELEDLSAIKDALADVYGYDEKRAAGFKYAGLGKRSDFDDDNDLYFDDEMDDIMSKRGLAYKYAGLGKRFKTTYRLTGLGKRSGDDVMDKRQAGFRYAGLGKRAPSNMRFAGLGKRSMGDDFASKLSINDVISKELEFPHAGYRVSSQSENAPDFMHSGLLEKRSIENNNEIDTDKDKNIDN